jgi:predicted peroxiredoxin
MPPETAMNWMIGFTAVASACLIIQVILLFVMTRASLAVKKQAAALATRLDPLIGKLEAITDTSRQAIEEVRLYAAEISNKTNDLLDLTRIQLVRVDDILGEAAARSRAQMDRIEMVLDDTVNRFQETTTLLQNSIVRPLRQVNAVTAGIRAALEFLARGRRATVEQATHDEEMFI